MKESSCRCRAHDRFSRIGVVSVGRRRRARSWQRHSEAGAAARAEAVVARPVPARLDVGDCDSAPGLLGGRFRASTITCRMGTGRAEGRCDLDHAAVAWPRVAVISSLPAHALLPIVLSGSLERPEWGVDGCRLVREGAHWLVAERGDPSKHSDRCESSLDPGGAEVSRGQPVGLRFSSNSDAVLCLQECGGPRSEPAPRWAAVDFRAGAGRSNHAGTTCDQCWKSCNQAAKRPAMPTAAAPPSEAHA